MISISHAPNSTRLQRRLAAKLLCAPWRWLSWRRGAGTSQLERWFEDRFTGMGAAGFSTGREALYAVLRALGVGPGDEVIIQAFTCIVVPHAVLWNGATAVYADVDDSLNISVDDIRRLITPKTKAVIVQHTFGVPARIAEILALCREKNIFCIEDCAHAFGASAQGREVGAWGDAAIFSFGRDKVVSSVAGGMAIIRDREAASRLRDLRDNSRHRPRRWIAQNLFHAALFRYANAILIRFGQMIGLFNRVYARQELASQQPAILTHRLPNAMSLLAMQQIESDLKRFQSHRAAIAALYAEWASSRGVRVQSWASDSAPSWLRFTLLLEQAPSIAQKMRERGFLLGDWYRHVIMPPPQGDTTLGYREGQCPRAEEAAKACVNLPTHARVSMSEARQLLNELDAYV